MIRSADSQLTVTDIQWDKKTIRLILLSLSNQKLEVDSTYVSLYFQAVYIGNHKQLNKISLTSNNLRIEKYQFNPIVKKLSLSNFGRTILKKYLQTRHSW